jgi:hypothetical protein
VENGNWVKKMTCGHLFPAPVVPAVVSGNKTGNPGNWHIFIKFIFQMATTTGLMKQREQKVGP